MVALVVTIPVLVVAIHAKAHVSIVAKMTVLAHAKEAVRIPAETLAAAGVVTVVDN